ncbi:MAG TPA: RDD family protein [Acidimicrobiia bacterium]|jgi:uncharacterized RDD family membrane protein YckC
MTATRASASSASRTGRQARAIALQGTRAGFVSRVVAAAIDVIAVFLLFLIALAAYAVVVYLLTDDPLTLPDPGAVWSSVGMLLLLIAVLTAAWSGPGRTLGDIAIGLRVVTDRGEGLGWFRALVRACVVVGLPLLSMTWILVSRKNAGWHDLVARTTVVYDWRPRGARRGDKSRPPR